MGDFVELPGLYVWQAKPKWMLRVGPSFSCEQMKAPNAFHRLMQRLFFGFKWERIS